MHLSTMFFVVAVVLFLIGIIISAAKIRVMTELDEEDDITNFSPQRSIWNLSGVTEPSSDAIDGEQ